MGLVKPLQRLKLAYTRWVNSFFKDLAELYVKEKRAVEPASLLFALTSKTRTDAG